MGFLEGLAAATPQRVREALGERVRSAGLAGAAVRAATPWQVLPVLTHQAAGQPVVLAAQQEILGTQEATELPAIPALSGVSGSAEPLRLHLLPHGKGVMAGLGRMAITGTAVAAVVAGVLRSVVS
jgi:hypothetical protein